MAPDKLGRPMRFLPTPGQIGDAPAAPALLAGFQPQAVLADKAYDSNALRKIIADQSATTAVPSNRTRKFLIAQDRLPKGSLESRFLTLGNP